MNPEWSWILPVHNGARWLRRAVLSILADAAPSDEVIVIDDGSDDHPTQVLPSDPRIVLLQQPHLGIVAALEAGRRAARASFLARLDADDQVVQGRRRLQHEALRNDARLAAVGGQARIHCQEGEVPGGMAAYVAWVNDLEHLERELLVESPLFHPAVTMRADALNRVGGYRDGPFPEDYDLWLRLVAAGYRLANVPSVVLDIEDHPGRLTRTSARYSQDGFDALKREFLKSKRLQDRQDIVVWCGPSRGKPWIKWLLGLGQNLKAVIDVGRKRARLGIQILRPDALLSLRFDLLLVIVGNRGARGLIRSEIARLRPELVEGLDWIALC